MVKKFMGCIMIVALLATLIGGATMAWFTNWNDGGTATFTAGTVNVSAGEAVIGGAGNWKNWNPGDCNEVKWSFTNSGSKSIYIRSIINKSWEGTGNGGTSETAWGRGIRFGGGWAMYFVALKNEEETIVELLAGQHHNAGQVKVWKDEINLYVEYSTTNGWNMTETHLYVSNTIPIHHAPGQMPYSHENLQNVVRDIYTIPLSNLTHETIYVAAHAVVENGGNLSDDNVIWTLCPDYETNWKLKNGYWYYLNPIPAGETVDICFKVCLSGNLTGNQYQGAKYLFETKVEAVQSSNNAIRDLWPNNPIEN